MLHRQVEVLADVGQAGDGIEQPVVDALRIAVERAQPLDARDRGDLLDQLGQAALPALVGAIAGRVLRDERELAHALRGQAAHLLEDIRLRTAAVAATDQRNRAVGAAVVAALADADVRAVLGCGQHAAVLKERAVVVRVDGALSGECLADGLVDLLILVDAEDRIDLGHLLADGFRVALGEAARRHQQAAHAGLLVLRHFKEGGDGLLLGGLDEAAGVDDDDLGPGRVIDDLIAVRGEVAEHLLGIDAVFAASQGNESDCRSQWNAPSAQMRG